MINKVLNEPVYDDDAVNKKYVDGQIEKVKENSVTKENNVYSTEETIVGTWVDNKPIYRKVIFFNCALFTTNLVYFGHNISNMDVIITQTCNWYDSQSNRWRAIPANYYSTLNWATQLTVDTNTVTFELGNSAYTRIRDAGERLYVILEYTKTTD